MASGTPELLHVIGYLTGSTLYAMLLSMVVRTRGRRDLLMAATAVLGLAWNVGELTAHALNTVGLPAGRDWVMAASYAALGFLGAVAVHAAGSADIDGRAAGSRGRQLILGTVYACATVAAFLHAHAAATGGALPSSMGLVLLTSGLVMVAAPLIVALRRQTQARRAFWMVALALFAVSSLHVSSFHLASESWVAELLGHHSSIPLAFAMLYQDYRFALADLFLKRALTLLALVAVVLGGWALVSSTFVTSGSPSPEGVAALLAAWMATALMFPWLHRAVCTFVDRTMLKRTGYGTLIDELTAEAGRGASASAILSAACNRLARALGANSVTWHEAHSVDVPPPDVVVPTAEAPHYTLSVGPLSAGRRLLSDDLAMLERVAFLLARRIDAVRMTEERYERVLREREIGALATEAELRALRAQINPHFLFNSLTTIGHLIKEAPSRAFDTLMHLTTLLRGALRSDGEFTTLGHERELIECYLQIEAARFEERLEVAIDIPDTLAHVCIPSLIVQPLVENAIKHGIAPSRRGGALTVCASLEASGSMLRIQVRNTGHPFNGRHAAAGSGIGLNNVEQRLRCYYGETAVLRLTPDENGATLAELCLPVGQPAGPHLMAASGTWP